ncbi:MAG TPA: S4 domain-containing protein, partial [Spirochaetota bacterium]|nr:S4 domain-containing protein [Spirochaetota bacterium]
MNDKKTITLTVPDEYSNTRIDVFIFNALEGEFSRSFIQKLLKGGNITVNGNSVKQNYKVKQHQEITIAIPKPEKTSLQPQDIPLTILFEDNDIAVIYKPAGMVVHPGAGNVEHTLVNALLYHFK